MNALFLPSNISMTSKEISELVEKRHDNVKRTIETLIEQGVIKSPQIEEISTATKPLQIYRFTGEQGKRDSIIVVAQLSPEFTARLVDRWQELEAKVTQPVIDLNDPAFLRSTLLTYTEKVIELEHKVETLAPKAEALDKITIADGEMCLSNAGKILGWQKLKDFFQWLHEIEWTFKRSGEWIAHQNRQREGLMVMKTVKYESSDGTEKVKGQALVTPKGLAKLAQLMSKKGELLAA